MGSYRVISSDDHMFEPPDLWTRPLGAKYGDRTPQILRTKEGGDWWFCDGVKGQPLASGTLTGVRFEDIDRLTFDDVEERVRPGGYDPDARVKDMDQDGVDASVIYPNAGFMMYDVPDTQLLNDVFQVYNDWISEHCKSYPERLKGIAMINLDDVQWGVEELDRCHRLGLSGALISVFPPPNRGYNLPDYDPFWAAAQDLGMPLSMHVGTNRAWEAKSMEDAGQRPAEHSCNLDYYVRMTLAQMILNGVFERFPGLQVGSIENDLSWAGHLIRKMDYTYTQRAQFEGWHRYKEDMLPSDYFHRNVFLGFQEDGLGVRLRDVIGVDNLQWGSDYPHQESTFPRSRQILDQILADCTEEEKAKIAGGNAARIYHIE